MGNDWLATAMAMVIQNIVGNCNGQWVMTDWKGGPTAAGLSPKTGVNSSNSHLIFTHQPGSLLQKSNQKPTTNWPTTRQTKKTIKARIKLFKEPPFIHTPARISFHLFKNQQPTNQPTKERSIMIQYSPYIMYSLIQPFYLSKNHQPTNHLINHIFTDPTRFS